MAILRLDRLGPAAAALLRVLGAPPGAALVGGAVRDTVLGRVVADVDVAVPSGALDLARRCAERLAGTCVGLEATLGLRLTAAAARAARQAAPGLGRVSPERIRDELLGLLALPETARALRRADALGLLGVVLPEVEAMRVTKQPAPHRFDVLEHSLRAVAGCDRLLARLDALAPYGEELATHVAEPLGGGARRGAALKLAALLHDVSKPETRRRVEGRVRFFEHDVLGELRERAIV